MMLEAGEYYLNANNEIININGLTDSKMYYDFSYNFYLNDGRYAGQLTKYDLIAHIPKQLLNHLVVEVNNYHTDNEFKQIIDNIYGETKWKLKTHSQN